MHPIWDGETSGKTLLTFNCRPIRLVNCEGTIRGNDGLVTRFMRVTSFAFSPGSGMRRNRCGSADDLGNFLRIELEIATSSLVDVQRVYELGEFISPNVTR